jgi:hypothetical protein
LRFFFLELATAFSMAQISALVCIAFEVFWHFIAKRGISLCSATAKTLLLRKTPNL